MISFNFPCFLRRFPMSSSDKTLVGRLIQIAASILIGCLLLWLAVWILQQIWIWLLIIAGLILVSWTLVLVLRWRRDRWLR